jgi:hypothetical protein
MIERKQAIKYIKHENRLEAIRLISKANELESDMIAMSNVMTPARERSFRVLIGRLDAAISLLTNGIF